MFSIHLAGIMLSLETALRAPKWISYETRQLASWEQAQQQSKEFYRWLSGDHRHRIKATVID
jgi:uncharacterized membrane protein affecting hemolysin expression